MIIDALPYSRHWELDMWVNRVWQSVKYCTVIETKSGPWASSLQFANAMNGSEFATKGNGVIQTPNIE